MKHIFLFDFDNIDVRETENGEKYLGVMFYIVEDLEEEINEESTQVVKAYPFHGTVFPKSSAKEFKQWENAYKDSANWGIEDFYFEEEEFGFVTGGTEEKMNTEKSFLPIIKEGMEKNWKLIKVIAKI